MFRRPIYVVDAFTRTPLQGNPAGVMPFARGLTQEQMLSVAREVHASETAFVLSPKEADVRLRFFTPTQEVPFCGHAFVATLFLLADLGEIRVAGDFARVRVETGVGILGADLVRDGHALRIDMTQAAPSFRHCTHPADEILRALGAQESDLRTDLPLELAYTGLWHLLVPLGSLDALDGLMPDFRAVAGLNRALGVLTTHVFVEEEDGIHCRGFAPVAGIDEDPVTGSAAGALGAYLLKHSAIRSGTPVRMHQGDTCGRPGEARVVVTGAPERPDSVVVGGRAVISMRGEIRLA
jgi:PhzF family phenazine biosynthesis protein